MSSSPECDLSEVERIKIERTYDRLQRLDYYEMLNLPEKATRSQIKKNYYLVSKEFHPDRFFRRSLGEYKEQLESIFDRLTKAYNTLNDEDRRLEYDKAMIAQSMARGPAVHEIAFDIGGKRKERGPGGTEKSGETSPGSTPQGEVRAQPKKKRPTGPRPVFMDRLQKQLMERLIKARDYLKTGKDAYERGQFGPAQSALQMAVAFDPQNKEAKKLLEDATTRVNELKAENHYQRGLQEEMVGNVDNARHYFKLAVDCKPKKGYYFFKLGMILLQIPDERRQGLEQIKRAIEFEPKNAEYLSALARAYVDNKMPRNAYREYEKVLLIDKGHVEAQKALKRLKAAI